MIVWRGFGIAAFLLFGGLFLLSEYLFKKLEHEHALHVSVTTGASGLIWLLVLKQNKKNKRLLKEAEDLLSRPELLDEETRKRAELRIKARNAAEMFDNSHLFFIPCLYWHYMFAGISLLSISLYFFY